MTDSPDPLKPFAGRIALVTGGGRGAGEGISLCLARAGATVAVNYNKDAEAAQATVDAITAMGGLAKAYQANVGDREQDRAMVEAVTSDLGPVDILVNNAGIASRGQSVVDTDPAEMERVVRIHAFGPHYLSAMLLPGMRQVAAQPGRRGDIVMVSTIGTRFFGPNGAPYGMGKAAMEALAYTLAKEEQRNNIHVNIVAPGLIYSEMGRRLVRATAGVQNIDDIDKSYPFGRICRPEDIGNVVVFLCSDAAGYVSGQRIEIDGGGAPLMRR